MALTQNLDGYYVFGADILGQSSTNKRISQDFESLKISQKLRFAAVCSFFYVFYAFLQNADVFLSPFEKILRNIHSLIHFIL